MPKQFSTRRKTGCMSRRPSSNGQLRSLLPHSGCAGSHHQLLLLKGVGNAEGPVEGIPEVDIEAFASEALGVVAVAFVLEAGEDVDRIGGQEGEAAGDRAAGEGGGGP